MENNTTHMQEAKKGIGHRSEGSKVETCIYLHHSSSNMGCKKVMKKWKGKRWERRKPGAVGTG